MSIHTFVRAS